MSKRRSRCGVCCGRVDNDLTKLAGGTPAAAGDVLDGYTQDDGSQHVNFVDAGGHIHELYRSPGPAPQWVDNDLTMLAVKLDTAFFSTVDGYAESDGSQHVNYIDAGGHVHELYRSPGPQAQWVDNDLHNLAGSTTAGPSAVAGYTQSDSSQHVNFIDEGGHVHELYRSPDPAVQWVDNDLTELAGGALANPDAAGNILAGYAQGDGSRHVNYIDANGHVHELYRNPDPAAQWVDNDLTKLAPGTPANRLALAGYVESDGSQHVNYVDANGHVHELYGSPS